ncbi:hypothetical protein MMC07_004115 [Pseudocyphellaria aurata]|nr:hypothetical protein [Pseudocyphellaria aurata]
MALPPEHITIKRRRDDEPVDTLYMPQKRQRWCRIDGCETSTEGRDVPNPTPESQVQAVTPRLSPTPSVVQTCLKRRRSSTDLFRPRTFHLSSSEACSSVPVAPISGLLKFKRHRKDLAVFVEKTKWDRQAQDTLRTTTIANTKSVSVGSDTQKDIDREPGSGDMPTTGAIDQDGRLDSSITQSDTVVNPSMRAQHFKASTGRGDLDEKTTENLYRIASHRSLTSTKGSGDMFYERESKIKPKPPKPRPWKTPLKSTESGGDDVVHGIVSLENEDDFVYDTYVRSWGQADGVRTDSLEQYDDGLHHVDSSKIGILIIAEHEQAVWETFGEEEESDKDWNSEEEDENAEDFYGNDYPEDELNSDDEFGMGAYDCRHRASDDEEFDEVAGWSDEEGEAQHPWQRTGWRVRLQDFAHHDD